MENENNDKTERITYNCWYQNLIGKMGIAYWGRHEDKENQHPTILGQREAFTCKYSEYSQPPSTPSPGQLTRWPPHVSQYKRRKHWAYVAKDQWFSPHFYAESMLAPVSIFGVCGACSVHVIRSLLLGFGQAVWWLMWINYFLSRCFVGLLYIVGCGLVICRRHPRYWLWSRDASFWLNSVINSSGESFELHEGSPGSLDTIVFRLWSFERIWWAADWWRKGVDRKVTWGIDFYISSTKVVTE